MSSVFQEYLNVLIKLKGCYKNVSSVLQESLKQSFKGVSNILNEYLFVLQFCFTRISSQLTKQKEGLFHNQSLYLLLTLDVTKEIYLNFKSKYLSYLQVLEDVPQSKIWGEEKNYAHCAYSVCDESPKGY